MTRTKATVKRRQQRRRAEQDAEKARLREAREAERQQQAEEDGCEEARPNTNNQDVGGAGDQHQAGEPTTVHDGVVQDAFHNSGEERSAEKEKEEEEKEEEEEEEENKAGENDGEEGQLLLTDYEKQREQRIKENAAKLATLNLPSLGSSLGPSRRPQRQASSSKRKKDDDYVPSSSSDSQDSDDYVTQDEDPSGQQIQQKDNNGDLDEDQALEQAIALSLHTPVDNTIDTRSKVSRTQRSKRQVFHKKGNAKRNRKGVQEQFTVEEVAAIFAIFDERGNGKFSAAELERVARTHDFTWSKQEIADMIDIFDGNKDGQLDLSEFQSIFGRMNMLRMHVT